MRWDFQANTAPAPTARYKHCIGPASDREERRVTHTHTPKHTASHANPHIESHAHTRTDSKHRIDSAPVNRRLLFTGSQTAGYFYFFFHILFPLFLLFPGPQFSPHSNFRHFCKNKLFLLLISVLSPFIFPPWTLLHGHVGVGAFDALCWLLRLLLSIICLYAHLGKGGHFHYCIIISCRGYRRPDPTWVVLSLLLRTLPLHMAWNNTHTVPTMRSCFLSELRAVPLFTALKCQYRKKPCHGGGQWEEARRHAWRPLLRYSHDAAGGEASPNATCLGPSLLWSSVKRAVRQTLMEIFSYVPVVFTTLCATFMPFSLFSQSELFC